MNISELATPSLLIDLGRAERNIARMAAKAGAAGVGVRPHFKTSKLIEVARRQLAAGAIGMTCATDRELEALLDAGVPSILWGHQTVGPRKVELAVAANRRAEVIVAVDSLDGVRALAEHAAREGITVPCVVEVDTGMNRAGVAPDAAAGLAVAVDALPGVRVAGLMTHEGQVHRHLDDPEGLVATARHASERMVAAGRACAAAGVAPAIVSVGSTPAATLAPLVDGITEIRPGTYVFLDANQVALGSGDWTECAVTVLARVVSHHRLGHPIVDAGLKALSGDGSIRGAGHGQVLALGATVATVYEEHGVLRGGEAERLRVGELVRIVPNHVCGAVNMWSEAAVVEGDAVLDTWQTVGRR